MKIKVRNPFRKTFGQKVKARMQEQLVEETAAAVFLLAGGILNGIAVVAGKAVRDRKKTVGQSS